MSRAAFYDSLVADPTLGGDGLGEDTICQNYSNDERPNNTGPFIILQWGITAAPIWQSEAERGPEQLTVWVHWPKELTVDYTKLNKILDQIDDVARDLRDVAGSDDYTLSFVTIGDRSGDLLDDGFNTITKNAAYQIYSRKS